MILVNVLQKEMSHNLTESEIFALLSKQQRRLILKILQESGTPLTITALAKFIGDYEYEKCSTNNLRNIQIRLYHVDIPKLEEADVVAYNDNEGTVRQDENFGVLIGFLNKVNESDLPWSDS